MGVIFAKKTKARKTRKLPPRENFHVYSISTLPTQSNVNKPPTIATKANKRKQESEQKQYIISLEKQVKEHEKTIQLLQKNLDALAKNIDQNNSTTVQDDPRPQSGQFGSISDLEVRIRQLEMQNMQNLCIFTALTSTLTMQQANSQSRGGMPIFPHSVYPQYPHIAGTTIPINPFQYATMQPPIVPLVNPLGQTMGYPPQAVPMARVPPPPPYHNLVFVQNPIPVVPQPPNLQQTRTLLDILIEELGLHSLPGSPTYNLTDFSASEVLDNHKSVLTSFGVQSNSEELDLPYIYWIPKMHKNPYKHRFIAGSSKCSTKPLSIILTKLLTHIKQGLQKYCETAYSRSGVNQMWILKNSKELLDHLKSPNFNLITNIKSFDFSTLYTTIPHQKLKSRLATIIRNSFLHKNGNRRYKYLVLGREGPYFVKEHSDAKNKYTEEDIIKMLEFLVDNIFVVFAGKVFQQIVGIPMGTNCAPLLADIFLYSYEAEFIQSLLSAGKKRLASQFNFTYRYIDDVLSINNPDFENYLGQMYPPELEIKDTTESNTSASYLDLLLSIGRDGQLRTSFYDKRDDFNFHITNFPFLSSNIPSSPAYGVFISQLIRYARACSSYECFILRAMRLSNKLLGQGYVKERLKSSLRKFYGRYGDLTKQYEVPLSRMLHDILDDDHIQ